MAFDQQTLPRHVPPDPMAVCRGLGSRDTSRLDTPFPAYVWMQANSLRMVCFASAHTICIYRMQSNKHELRRSQRLR